MEKNKSAYDVLIDMYKSQVEKADQAGNADLFKACADAFFTSVNENSFFFEKPVHFKDIEYLNGYFVFGMGTNKVVHFRVEECPGWLFGIWWGDPKKDNEGGTTVPGEFFTQYEENLDKFKPSRCEMAADVEVYSDGHARTYKASNIINFIKNEPYLAFCRDYNGWDYNVEFHSREEAKEEFDKFVSEQDNNKKYTEICDNEVIKFVRSEVLPLFAGAEIIKEDCCTPKYSVVAPFEKNQGLVRNPGWYGWFDHLGNEGRKAMSRFKSVVEACADLAEDHDVYWTRPVHEMVFFYEEEHKYWE